MEPFGAPTDPTQNVQDLETPIAAIVVRFVAEHCTQRLCLHEEACVNMIEGVQPGISVCTVLHIAGLLNNVFALFM